MNRNWMPATLRWLTPEEGGRRQAFEGEEYAATARFVGDSPEAMFSVVIRRIDPRWNANSNSIEISLLFPENLPSVGVRLRQELLIITEGPRPVAECRVMQPATA